VATRSTEADLAISTMDGNASHVRAGPKAWRRRSIRAQVLGTVLLINLLAAIAAGFVVIWNARTRTDREMAASVGVTERFIRDAIARLSDTRSESLPEGLTIQARGQRHVRIRVEHADGRVVDLVQAKARDETTVPGWFSTLVGAREMERTIPILVQGKSLGQVIVVGVPTDEIAEVWEDVRDFLVIAIGVNLTILLALYFALGRVVSQLRSVAFGLGALEQGRFAHRMEPPPGRELAALTERFNALAGALDAARQDNARLTRALVSTQDDERRQIAADLHDELGPCLFGLKANAGSLGRLVKSVSSETAARMQERVATIIEIAERMQTLNRRLLQKLRPVALDHVPLGDVLANLVTEFESHAPERRFILDLGSLAPRYGDSVDVTLYRCIQEGVTNALKHGDASLVHIEVREVKREGRWLCLRIEDDGHGLPAAPMPGMGLLGMRERVRALGGECRISTSGDAGVCVLVDIPIDMAQADGVDPRSKEDVG
jgi:two-component system sensor histidine kinase UhpB